MMTPKGLKEVQSYAQYLGPWLPQIMKKNEKGKYTLTSLSHEAKKLKLKIIPYTHRSDVVPDGFENDAEFRKYLKNQTLIDGIFSDHGDVWMK
jgi:glycerophosphoryl diester phosphodiesterase